MPKGEKEENRIGCCPTRFVFVCHKDCALKTSLAGVRLLAETEGLDDGTIAVYVDVIEIVEQCTTLTNEVCKGTCGDVILVVLLYMLCEMCDAIGEQCNLALCRTCVSS